MWLFSCCCSLAVGVGTCHPRPPGAQIQWRVHSALSEGVNVPHILVAYPYKYGCWIARYDPLLLAKLRLLLDVVNSNEFSYGLKARKHAGRLFCFNQGSSAKETQEWKGMRGLTEHQRGQGLPTRLNCPILGVAWDATGWHRDTPLILLPFWFSSISVKDRILNLSLSRDWQMCISRQMLRVRYL